MDNCNYRDKTINCAKTGEIPNDHECCYQKDGNKKFGHLVKKGTCNYNTGFCEGKPKGEKSIRTRIVSQITEGFNGTSKNHLMPAFLILLILIVLLIITIFKK